MCRVAGGLFSLSRDHQGEKLTALYNHCHIYGVAFQFLLLLSTGVHFFSFIKQLVNPCHVPGAALGIRNTVPSERHTRPWRDLQSSREHRQVHEHFAVCSTV